MGSLSEVPQQPKELGLLNSSKSATKTAGAQAPEPSSTSKDLGPEAELGLDPRNRTRSQIKEQITGTGLDPRARTRSQGQDQIPRIGPDFTDRTRSQTLQWDVCFLSNRVTTASFPLSKTRLFLVAVLKTAPN